MFIYKCLCVFVGQYAQAIGEAVWKELDKLLKDVSDGEKGVRDAADLAAKEGMFCFV